VTYTAHAITVTAVPPTGDPFDLAVVNSQVTLDDEWSPYGQGTVRVTAPDAADLERLDPRDLVRLTIVLEQNITPTTTRTFDVLLHSRENGDERGEIILGFATDELLLLEGGHISTTPLTHLLTLGYSLRAVVAWVLSRIDAVLQPGIPDADFTPVYATTNRFEQGTAEISGLTRWLTTSPSTGARSSTSAHSGTYSYACTKAGVASSSTLTIGYNGSNAAVPVVAGEMIQFAVWVRTPGTSSAVQVNARYYNAAGTVLSTSTSWASVNSSTTWQLLSLADVVPAGATQAAMLIYIATAGAGQIHYFDDAFIGPAHVESGAVIPVEPFSGSSSDSLYTYAWVGATNSSASTRTPLVSRDPAALVVLPGTKWWDALAPFVQTAGFRLFCDEQRRWYLVDSTYSVPGTLVLDDADNLTRVDTTISRANDDWFDSVVVEYRWNDDTGATQSAYDAASGSSPTKVYSVIHDDTPFPGVGAAAALLERAESRGRTITVEAVNRYDAQPDIAVELTLEDVPDQEGVVSRVSWSSPANTMTIATRALVDA